MVCPECQDSSLNLKPEASKHVNCLHGVVCNKKRGKYVGMRSLARVSTEMAARGLSCDGADITQFTVLFWRRKKSNFIEK